MPTRFKQNQWIILHRHRYPSRMAHLRTCIGRIKAIRPNRPKYEIVWYPPTSALGRPTSHTNHHRAFWGIEDTTYLSEASDETLNNPEFAYAVYTESAGSGLAPVQSLNEIAPHAARLPAQHIIKSTAIDKLTPQHYTFDL